MFFGFSRRQLFKLISGLIAVTAALGSIPFMGKFFASGVQAQRTINQETYKNRTYKIIRKTVDNSPQTLQDTTRAINNPYNAPFEVYLDGQKVDILRDKKTGKYVTHLLPFTEYDSPTALVKALIDLHVSVTKKTQR
jgi:hypothetical protein